MKARDLKLQKLLDLLQLKRKLDVKSVVEALGVSEATARRMFAELAEDGKLLRIHGGIQLLPEMAHDYSYRVSAAHREREKTIIGQAAAKIIQNGESIFLDSGTTALKLGEALPSRLREGTLKDITVMTTSLAFVETLADTCKVILLGGEIRPERHDVSGVLTHKIIGDFHFDKAFIGADAIHPEFGFMTTDEETAILSQLAIRNSNETCVLADSEKFKLKSFVTYASPKDIDQVFTDPSMDGKTFKKFSKLGFNLIKVD